MWEDLFELIIVDEDLGFAHLLASFLEPAGFKVTVTQSLQDAMAYPRSEASDFLLMGFQGQGALHLQQIRHIVRSMSNTRVLAMVSEELESYEELLRQTGICRVISRQPRTDHRRPSRSRSP